MNTYLDKNSATKSQATRAIAQRQESKHSSMPAVDKRPQAAIQRKLQEGGSSFAAKVAQRHAAGKVIQRQMLPVARHREIVVDAAKRLVNPTTATDKLWIKAIYKELDGIGNPSWDKCVEKLIEQRVLDQNDWNVIENDYKLYRTQEGKGFDLFERHNVPAVFNEDTANKWVASLVENRIHDLYSTLPGFNGHAVQVQAGITSLNNWYQAGKFSKDAYDKYKINIINELQQGKNRSPLPIPEFVYRFADESSIKI